MINSLTIEDANGSQMSFFGDQKVIKEVSGLVGLTSVRSVLSDKPNRDGSNNRSRYRQDRIITINGMFAGTPSQIWSAYDDLQYILEQAKDTERILRYTRTADGRIFRMLVQFDAAFDAPLKVTDAGVVMPYQVQLRASNPNAYSDAEIVAQSSPLGGSSGGGSTYPSIYADTYVAGGAGTGGWVDFNNDGSVETWPVFRIYGDVVTPVIHLESDPAVKKISLSSTIAAGHFVEIDTLARTIKTDIGLPASGTLDVTNTKWFSLPARTAGGIRLTGVSGAGWLQIRYRTAHG